MDAAQPTPNAQKPLEQISLAECQKAATGYFKNFEVKIKRRSGLWHLTRKHPVTQHEISLGHGPSPGHAFVEAVSQLNARKTVQNLKAARAARLNELHRKEKAQP